MSKTITITLPDHLEQALSRAQQQTHQSVEETILQLLTQLLTPATAPDLENDPLIALFGSIQSDIPDLADRHDDYLGQALDEEMHHNE